MPSSNTTSFNVANFVPAGLGLLAAIVIFFVLTDRPLPLITSDRAALIVLVVIGFVMCSSGGIGKAITAYGWSHPVTIVGSILGILLLLMVGAVLLGVQLPLITNDRAAIIALAVIGAVKVMISIAASVITSRTL